MPKKETFSAQWAKIVASWKEAEKDRMVPEYREDHDRHHNTRYYK